MPDLGSNFGGTETEFDELAALRRELAEKNARIAEKNAHIEALTRESNSPLSNVPTVGEKPLFARVNIILEENEGIAPSGQYFALHGNWVNPEMLETLESKVQSGEMTRAEATAAATEKVQFEAYLRPGEEASVPVELLTILNDALEDKPIIDPLTNQVLGYKQKLRYPYRITSSRNKATH